MILNFLKNNTHFASHHKSRAAILFLLLPLLLGGCSGSSAPSEKSTELSAKYEYYQSSVKNLRNTMDIDANQADDIFLILVGCGMDNEINMVSLKESLDDSIVYNVWSSGTNYIVTLNSNGIVDTVVTPYLLSTKQLYPEAEEPADTNTPESNSKKDTDNAADNQTKIPARESSVGTSDGNIDTLAKNLTVLDVHNDATGNWRYITIAEDTDFLEYALSYYNTYFEDDKEIHAVVNFTNNTTTKISVVSNMLDVTIHEYVDKEELNADLLFSGSVYSEYFIYKDNGDIEKVQ